MDIGYQLVVFPLMTYDTLLHLLQDAINHTQTIQQVRPEADPVVGASLQNFAKILDLPQWAIYNLPLFDCDFPASAAPGDHVLNYSRNQVRSHLDVRSLVAAYLVIVRC